MFRKTTGPCFFCSCLIEFWLRLLKQTHWRFLVPRGGCNHLNIYLGCCRGFVTWLIKQNQHSLWGTLFGYYSDTENWDKSKLTHVGSYTHSPSHLLITSFWPFMKEPRRWRSIWQADDLFLIFSTFSELCVWGFGDVLHLQYNGSCPKCFITIQAINIASRHLSLSLDH